MKSRYWIIGSSVTAHCCFSESLVKFEVPVTKDEAERHVNYSVRMDHSERIKSECLCEFLGDEAFASFVLDQVRAKFEGVQG